MTEYILSSEALTHLLVRPHPDSWRQSPEAALWPPDALAQAILARISLLADLKNILPAEVHNVLDRQIRANLTPDPEKGFPPRPPGHPGPWPPPNWKFGPVEQMVIAAHYLNAAQLHPAVAEQGEALMHQAVRQLNTGHR